MYLAYTFILTAGLILTFPYYLIRFRKYRPTLSDRFGFLKIPQLNRSIWVHAVSVGEVKAVEKLVERLREQFRSQKLVVSTTTPAGQQLACERQDIVDHTFYFPIDLPWCVRRTLNRVNPEMVIIAETEIWPNFLKECRKRKVRVVMINGRISDRSYSRYRLVRPWLRRVFEDYTILGMQSELDRQRIEAIGANPGKVTVLGNLKYDSAASSRHVDNTLSEFLTSWDPLWIAASTMPGEDELVLDAFQQVLKSHPHLKLVIAPRHADRFDAVAEIIKARGFEFARRSEVGVQRECVSAESRILLLDTMGELATIFQFATVTFIGGSLVPTGGHNILEPARYSKPIVIGPHMQNFRDMARLFADANAAIQIGSALELGRSISSLLSNPQRALEIGRNAFRIVQQNTGATERALQLLEPVEARR